MNNKKKLGAAFISLAVSGLAGLMLVAPGALANGQWTSEAACLQNRHAIGESKYTRRHLRECADPTSGQHAIYDGTPMHAQFSEQSQNVYVTGNSQDRIVIRRTQDASSTR